MNSTYQEECCNCMHHNDQPSKGHVRQVWHGDAALAKHLVGGALVYRHPVTVKQERDLRGCCMRA